MIITPKLTQVAHQNCSKTASWSAQMASRVVENSYWSGVLVSGHSELASNVLRINLVVDFTNLCDRHQGHGVCVNAKDDSVLPNDGRNRFQRICMKPLWKKYGNSLIGGWAVHQLHGTDSRNYWKVVFVAMVFKCWIVFFITYHRRIAGQGSSKAFSLTEWIANVNHIC